MWQTAFWLGSLAAALGISVWPHFLGVLRWDIFGSVFVDKWWVYLSVFGEILRCVHLRVWGVWAV